ncbi:MAG TPA: hypothetical protein VG406_28870 [Isosphaeraceae bacterium]|jgi:hypothetical protein|nr:hypothetical protein [Isosphaeraceae bacterium]
MSGRRRRRAAALGVALAAAVAGNGCGIRPRFLTINHPAPIVRARSAGLGDGLPDAVVVPSLIDKLSDPDPVVQLSADQALRKRTGRDFGFHPWADPAERAKAVARWRSWWQAQPASRPQAQVATARPRDVKRSSNPSPGG